MLLTHRLVTRLFKLQLDHHAPIQTGCIPYGKCAISHIVAQNVVAGKNHVLGLREVAKLFTTP